jgi:Tol biopolymer transport system component
MRRAWFVAMLAAVTTLGVGVVPATGVVPGGDGLIAFTVIHQAIHGNIALIQADGTGLIELPEVEGVSDFAPAWSPDGTRIAYERLTHTDGDNDIWVMDADGTNRGSVTRNWRSDYNPSWSPDGTMLVFERLMRSGHTPRLWVKVLGGPKPTRVTNVWSALPAWSPDGSVIMFTNVWEGPTSWVQDLYTVSPDGTSMTRLTKTPNLNESFATWSPDGSHIAFTSVSGSRRYDVYAMEADATDVVNLTNTPDQEEGVPAWSPSGGWIAYVISDEGLWVMASDGSDPVLVTGSFEAAWAPDWQAAP